MLEVGALNLMLRSCLLIYLVPYLVLELFGKSSLFVVELEKLWKASSTTKGVEQGFILHDHLLAYYDEDY